MDLSIQKRSDEIDITFVPKKTTRNAIPVGEATLNDHRVQMVEEQLKSFPY